MRKCPKRRSARRSSSSCTQCAKGSSMSWAPYLLNSFLEDCKDAQDWGSEFHYSWLLILIALMGWQEPTYTVPAKDRKMWHNALHIPSKHNRSQGKKINNDMFTILNRDPKQTWQIHGGFPETVQEFGQIANFQASRHSMWLQEKKDPTKEWLQLKYCVTMQDIHMEVQEWPEEWKVPTIPKKCQEYKLGRRTEQSLHNR
jgi:hypothetical protein